MALEIWINEGEVGRVELIKFKCKQKAFVVINCAIVIVDIATAYRIAEKNRTDIWVVVQNN